MEASIARKQAVSDITPPRASNGKRDESGRRTVYARLSVADAALTRLLSVSGSQTDFILASADGSTTVRVGLAVTSVPAAALVLGSEGVVLDWSSSTIMRGATCASLTRMELRLLVILMDHAPAPAPREQLIARMWPTHSPHGPDRDAALPVWICALRRRFAAIGLPQAIRTVRSTGYGLCL